MNPSRSNLKSRACVAVFFLLIGAWFWHEWLVRRENAPNETAAGRAALYEKFSGPGYFHIDSAGRKCEEFYIERGAAEMQIQRVTEERGLAASERSSVQRIVERCVESSPSRAVGGARVNVLQLNLALDEEHPPRSGTPGPGQTRF